MLGQRISTYLKFLIHIVKMSSREVISISFWSAVYRGVIISLQHWVLYCFPILTILISILYFKFILSNSFHHMPIFSIPFGVLMSRMRHNNSGVTRLRQSRNGLSSSSLWTLDLTICSPGLLLLYWQLTGIQYALSSLFTCTANIWSFPSCVCRIDFSKPR